MDKEKEIYEDIIARCKNKAYTIYDIWTYCENQLEKLNK